MHFLLSRSYRVPLAVTSSERVMSSLKTQTIFRAAGERSFTPIRNDFLQNPDVPYEVKGLVSEILSRPKDWHVSVPGILETNNTVGKRKLHRMLIDAQPFIRGVRDHDDKGRIECVIYYVSDDPAEVEKAIQKKISATAKELVRAMDKQKSEAASDPQRQNSIVDTEPECSFAELDNAALDFAPQQKKEEKKERYEEKKESLSHAAQPAAAADERDAALARFENVKKAAKWNPQTSFSAAEAQFIKLPAEDQERAVDEAPRYERDSKGCDHRVSLNRYIRDRMFDRPKPEEPKPKGMPNVVWNEIQEAKAAKEAKEAGPPPDPAIQWRAYIDKRIANGGRDGRRILKSQIIHCLEGSRGWDRANCPLDWVVENYFPDLVEEPEPQMANVSIGPNGVIRGRA